jgi:hypothetical protein
MFNNTVPATLGLPQPIKSLRGVVPTSKVTTLIWFKTLSMGIRRLDRTSVAVAPSVVRHGIALEMMWRIREVNMYVLAKCCVILSDSLWPEARHSDNMQENHKWRSWGGSHFMGR